MKYWTLNYGPLMVYPEVLFPLNFGINPCRAEMETLRASCIGGNQQVTCSLAELQASTTQAVRTTTSGLEAVQRRLDRVEAQARSLSTCL